MPVYWASLLKTPNFLSPSLEALNFEEARLQNLETDVGYRWWSLHARSMEKGTWPGGPGGPIANLLSWGRGPGAVSVLWLLWGLQ